MLLKTSLTWLKISPTCREDPAKAAAPPGDQEDFAQEAAPAHQMILRKKEHSAIRGRLFATTEPGTSSYQYNEHNRPGSVKDNFGGSPYTGYDRAKGNMHYSNYGRQHQNPGQNDHAGQSGSALLRTAGQAETLQDSSRADTVLQGSSQAAKPAPVPGAAATA